MKSLILNRIKDFPYSLFTKQDAVYRDREMWYNGDPLRETIMNPETGEKIAKYPLHINPLRSTAKKHAGLLIGQTTNSIMANEAPVQIVASYLDKNGERDKELSAKATEIIADIFGKSKAAALFIKNAIRSQYLGGSVFMVSFEEGNPNDLTIIAPSAKNFIGIPDGEDMWDLSECWYFFEIGRDDAVRLGASSRSNNDDFLYVEHWTKSEVTFYVNEFVVKKDKNPYGVVPAVYIPHIRVETFIGESIVSETAKGIIKELNLRWADVGDAVSLDSHSLIAARNIKGNLKQTTHAGRQITLLGDTGSLTGSGHDPDMFSVTTSSVSQPMMKFGDKLMDMYRRDANHPAVADGEDEGSQRSSVTITARMYPMVSEVEVERTLWSTGLATLVRIIMIMANEKKLYGVTESFLNPSVSVQWRTMLLRDRVDIANEVGVRAAHGITSKEHLNEMFGDVDDPLADTEQASIDFGKAAVVEQHAK